jgi:diguanylate cyclase (GGDEF)-like protein/PAS domain S-box-containing protein
METTDLVFLFSLEGKLREIGRAASDELGYSEEDALALNFFADLLAVPSPAKMEQLCKSLADGQNVTLAGTVRRRDGSGCAVQLMVFRPEEGRDAIFLCVAKKPEEEKTPRENARKVALRDPVTGLSTRAFFFEELQQMDSERYLPLSVIRGDLNGMKLINSVYGHITGDKLLKAAARVLRKHSRNSDILVRWEGDEFLLLLPRTREDDAAAIVERIEDAFKKTKIREILVPPSISMGYAAKMHRWQDFGNVLQDAEEDMREKQQSESRKIRTKLLSSLQKSLDEHTPETEEHTNSMRRIGRIMADLLQLPPEERELLDLAVRFHDVGKAALPVYLLNKMAPITEEERETLRRHAETGGKIAEAATSETAKAAPVIRAHHERWDGTGYPSKLAGEDIPLLSRIISVADAFDVMTRGTAYKHAVSPEEALEELQRLAGLQFDPRLVDLFAEHTEKFLTDESPDALPECGK